jgi:hypothetical protein
MAGRSAGQGPAYATAYLLVTLILILLALDTLKLPGLTAAFDSGWS